MIVFENDRFQKTMFKKTIVFENDSLLKTIFFFKTIVFNKKTFANEFEFYDN